MKYLKPYARALIFLEMCATEDFTTYQKCYCALTGRAHEKSRRVRTIFEQRRKLNGNSKKEQIAGTGERTS